MKIYMIVVIFILTLFIESATSEDKKLKNNKPIALIGFGSPIVDGIINYEADPKMGERIKAKLDYHMSGNFPLQFFSEVMESENTSIYLGGSALNAIRAANYVLRLFNSNLKPVVGFVGSIGKDKYGALIKSSLISEKIIFHGEEFDEERTSTTIVLVENSERAFYSDLGASEKITIDHFDSFRDSISTTKIFHSDAYLIGKRFECYKHIYNNFHNNNNILLSLNMASDFIIRDFFNNIDEIIPLLDIIFLNESEADMWKSKSGIQTDTTNILEFYDILTERIEKKNKNKKLIIVNTRGKQDTIVYVVDYKNHIKANFSIPIVEIDEQFIIDLNGAGDAFSGGFLAGLLLGKSLEDCARMGNQLASEIIQLRGFQLPERFPINQCADNEY